MYLLHYSEELLCLEIMVVFCLRSLSQYYSPQYYIQC